MELTSNLAPEPNWAASVPGSLTPTTACRPSGAIHDRGLLENHVVADVLERVAELLAAQDASPFRVRAYRRAAHELRRLREPVRDVFAARGLEGLDELPGVGPSIGGALAEYLETGRLGLLQRLEGQTSPEDLFASLPGIGDELARRIHRELGVDTLEELELAAHDGRLREVPGFGPRRVKALRDLLASRLSRSLQRRAIRGAYARSSADPGALAAPALSVPALLALDAEYRERAARGELRTIAPRRFNPTHEAWLPIWHTERDGWNVTALFSNTALAHQLGTTRDWLVLYCERDGQEDQCTIVTERRGPLAGRRVVRGRESECQVHYRERASDSTERSASEKANRQDAKSRQEPSQTQ
jgi:DNA polymerase (family X)